VATVRRTWRRRLAAAAPWLLVALLGTLVGLLIGYWLEQLLPAPPEGMPLPLQSLYLLQRL
jgi:predicted lysophospholipase L1 biosynthesis ABC-type transport system permease subunit